MSSVFLLSCCAAIALCQSTSYSALPSALPYTDGNFSSPYGPTHVFTEGAYLNISWESDYSSANLYLIRGQDFADPISIASKLSHQQVHRWKHTDKVPSQLCSVMVQLAGRRAQ